MMQNERAYCRFCTGEILEAAYLCKNCGSDLHALRIVYSKTKASSQADCYQLVPDGATYGVALGTEVVLHGMDRENAQIVTRILNEVLAAEKAG